jgi:hypothetical protein
MFSKRFDLGDFKLFFDAKKFHKATAFYRHFQNFIENIISKIKCKQNAY